MARISRRLGWIALAASVAGCAGKLIVYDADQKPVAGMPFRAAEVYVKQGIYDKSSTGGECAPMVFQSTVALPTGAQYYVTATSSAFAKTAFHLKYNDAGGISEVGLDSEPAVADTITAVADLVKAVAPAGFRAADTTKGKLPPCDAGASGITYERFDDYLRRQPKPRP